LSFVVPPLATAEYTMARWCPSCRLGRSFFVGVSDPGVGVPEADRTTLDLEMPDARASCPVTTSRVARTGVFTFDNGLLASTVPTNGIVVAATWEDGSLFWKPGWRLRGKVTHELIVRGERLDAPAPPMRVLAVRWGGGSWRTASTFPSEGCWRISGRSGDIALSYVVKVVRGS
jgi:hypothetical protein